MNDDFGFWILDWNPVAMGESAAMKVEKVKYVRRYRGE
jgi:hypothetical protein